MAIAKPDPVIQQPSKPIRVGKFAAAGLPFVLAGNSSMQETTQFIKCAIEHLHNSHRQ